ncbi:hypothetical protein HYW83_06425 [Candidatus Peregrinibacteria bacterium]|nr:hypothetical protein [Candidatus Peregrinibacteria bacterium]
MALFQFFALIPFTVFSVQAAPVPDFQAPLHGIYLTSYTVANKQGENIMAQFAKLGGNMIVFDVQDSGGRLSYPSNLPLSIELDNRNNKIPDLAATVKKIHDQGFYATARFVLFKNTYLAARKPAWTLKQRKTGKTFFSRDGPIWLDPGNAELKEYLIDIGRELAAAGVDEIQFDYVRFPEGGRGGYVGYRFTGDETFSRDQALTNFVSEIATELHYLGIKVSVDVFGIVVWDNVSWKVIGQNVGELAKHVDAIYPMPYPSHFGYGWGGHRNPADEPYFFVKETTKKFVEQTKGTDAQIRPWLQGFAMRVTKYGPGYVREQIRALRDIGIEEFSIWNAANNYGIVFKGLE